MENSNKVIDKEFLRSIIDNDFDFEKELFSIFVENAHRNLAKMESALKEADNNAWYMSSHAFKGSSASIGAFELAKLCEYAQKHPEDSKEEKEKILQDIRKGLTAVLEFINEELLEK